MAQRTVPAGGPLAGIKVVDLTSIVLGPFATRILGDYGAEVIKIEALDGDLMRANGVSRSPGMSSIHLAVNRNKSSVAVNLKTPEGKEIARRLLAGADVLVHNMRVPAMEALGLGYEAVSAINPRIVYCAGTGFGQAGPHAGKPAFDDIIQAASGLAGLVGAQHGTPDYSPTVFADKTAGMALANAVLAALVYRERAGVGQYVEVPMFETLVDFMMVEHLGGLTFVPTDGPAGYARVVSGGRRLVATRDGHMAILPYTPAQWRAFFERAGHAEVVRRHDFSSRDKLNACVRLLNEEMARITPERTTAEWLALCDEVDIASTPIFHLGELPEHPHLKAVGLFEQVEHATEGSIRQVRPTTLFTRSPAAIRHGAPTLGQDTHEVLAAHGYADAEIDRLAAARVIACDEAPGRRDSS